MGFYVALCSVEHGIQSLGRKSLPCRAIRQHPTQRLPPLRNLRASVPGSLLCARPLIAGLIILPLLAVIIGSTYAVRLAFLPKPEVAPPTLEAALEQLDSGNLSEARKIAAELRADKSASYTDLGGAMFVLGLATYEEASSLYNVDHKDLLYLIAARYLEESQLRGFPEGREAEGLLKLGTSLHQAQRPALAIPVLESALPLNPDHATEIHRLLTDGCLLCEPPRPEDALRHNQQYLAMADLSPAQRQAGQILQARIQLLRKDFDGARESLSKIPADSSVKQQALLLSTWLLEQEIGNEAGPSGAAAETDRALFEEKIKQLRGLFESVDISQAVAAQAHWLLGVCYERSGDTRAALAQYARTRKLHLGTPEAKAAALREALLLWHEANLSDAILALQKALNDAGPAQSYQNPWIPLAEAQARLEATFRSALKQKEFARADEIAKLAGSLTDPTRSMLWQAETQTAWSDHLMSEAKSQLPSAAALLRHEGREHLRQAGANYRDLAKLRLPTRFYLDDLYASADSFLSGHSYEQAVVAFQLYLKQNPQSRQPEALTGLGESLLTIGKLEPAIEVLDQCLTRFPRHPATYRARLLSSKAFKELNQIDKAKALLLDNLYKFSLTPASMEWQDSLFALGELHYDEAIALETASRSAGVDSSDADQLAKGLVPLEKAAPIFDEAIQVLSEALNRFEKAPQAAVARYQLAESRRHASKLPRKKIATVAAETTKSLLLRQSQNHLQAALTEYSRLISELNEEQDSVRGGVNHSFLRNSYFGKADTLYELGRFEDAITAYSAATNRYQHEPEAIAAYVQIASCYRQLSKTVEARGTLQQAKVVLSRIRSDADFSKTTPYTREEWTSLLEWLVSL